MGTKEAFKVLNLIDAEPLKERAPTKARAGEPPMRIRPDAKARDFKTVMARINWDGGCDFKKLCADLDTSQEDVIVNLLNAFLAAHGRYPSVVKTRRPGTVKSKPKR